MERMIALQLLLFCAVSSVVEHYLDTVGVGGSKPPPRTILIFNCFIAQNQYHIQVDSVWFEAAQYDLKVPVPGKVHPRISRWRFRVNGFWLRRRVR